MSAKRLDDIAEIDGEEGTKIKQIFHPHNTLSGIRYSLSHCVVNPGKSSKPHKMKTSEIYYFLQGTGILNVDDEKIEVSEDQAVFVSPQSKQFIKNTGNEDLRFLCIVDPAWKQEDEILLD